MALFPRHRRNSWQLGRRRRREASSRTGRRCVAVREQVLKALEEARNAKQIGKAVEAQVTVDGRRTGVLGSGALSRSTALSLHRVGSDAGAKKSGNGTGAVSVQVSKADGQKCERCWNYSIHVGEDQNYPTVCERCSAVLKEIEAEAQSGRTERYTHAMRKFHFLIAAFVVVARPRGQVGGGTQDSSARQHSDHPRILPPHPSGKSRRRLRPLRRFVRRRGRSARWCCSRWSRCSLSPPCSGKTATRYRPPGSACR